MANSSTIRFYNDETLVCGVSQMYDGDLGGVGIELYNFLNNIEIIDGIGLGQEN